MLRRRSSGFTLLELLVATAVLSILGTAVVVILRGGIKTWRRGETRRESFEVAQAVMGQLQDDLGDATVDPATSVWGRDAEAVFFGDRDGSGRSFLTLVRTIRGESEGTITGHAGSAIGGDARIDYRDDMKKALDGRLRATGGLMEVAYAMGDPGSKDEEVLFRGIRSPIGGRTSFFQTPKLSRAPLPGDPAPAKQPAEGIALLRAFATRVVYFELLYATPYTTTWSTDVRPLKTDGRSGPIDYWDSTRSLKPAKLDPKVFTTFADKSSRSDVHDDVLPSRVKVTLVVREGDAAESSTNLIRDLKTTDQEIVVSEPDRVSKQGFVLIDREWIEIDDITGARLHVKARGARRTKPAEHGQGAEVVIGRTFETVIPLAAGREDWSDK